MFGPSSLTQTYEVALAVVTAGNARLVTTTRYTSDTPSDPETPLKNKAELDHAIYRRFAQLAPSNVQAFVCGAFGNWDGTSRGDYCDGMVFHSLRQPFMDALQHHRDPDGASYLWGFVSRYQTFMVLGPGVELRRLYYTRYQDGTERFFETEEESHASRAAGSGWCMGGSVDRVLPLGQRLP